VPDAATPPAGVPMEISEGTDTPGEADVVINDDESEDDDNLIEDGSEDDDSVMTVVNVVDKEDNI